MRPRASAAEWRKRVERWKESGLSAEQFATETGLAAATLRVWGSKLNRAATMEASAVTAKRPSTSAPFVEVHASGVDTRFELELGRGWRLRVPDGFDPKALERLLGIPDRR